MVCRLKEQIRLATGTELLAFSTLKTWGDLYVFHQLWRIFSGFMLKDPEQNEEIWL